MKRRRCVRALGARQSILPLGDHNVHFLMDDELELVLAARVLLREEIVLL